MIGFVGIGIYAFIAVLAVLWLLFLHNTVAVIIAAFVFILPVFPLLFNNYAMKRITVEFDERNNDTDLGYDRAVYVTIKNPTFMPVIALEFVLTVKNGFYAEKSEYCYSLPVYPKQVRHEILHEPVFNACGVYNVKIDKIHAWDFMHFYATVKKEVKEKNISVLPERYKAVALKPDKFIIENSDTQESTKKGSDYPEVKDVREYIPGDSLKNIHWKLSSKKETLMVKEHINLASDCIVVVIELTENGKHSVERVLRTAYTVLYNWAKDGNPFTLWWWSEAENDMRSMVVNNVEQLDNCFLTLMTEKPYKETEKAVDGFVLEDSFVTNAVWISTTGTRGEAVLIGGDYLEEKPPENREKHRKKQFRKKTEKSEEKTGAFVSYIDL